ncbi:porin [Shewanella maritima]|uniref:porin n=1 Tax=Shewanella maritima TaxID=2520507 RepID=UPI003736F680
MKKSLVASALAAAMFVPAASAIEIYKDDRNTVSIGGYVDARIYHGQSETELVNGASRINFGFDRNMGNGWSANALFEWGVNPFGDSKIKYDNDALGYENGNFLSNRLGYVGLAHDDYGQITFGKQWGAWYDVVYATNNVIVWDGDASGTYTFNKGDGSVNGTGRGDKTVQYRNAFGDFSFAVQAQLKQDSFSVVEDEFGNPSIPGFPLTNDAGITSESLTEIEYNNTYGIALTYDVTDSITLTAGYNAGEFRATTSSGERYDARDSIYGVGFKYGDWAAEGFYAAANYSKQENHDTDNAGRPIQEAYGIETLVSYRFDNNIRILAAYNRLDAGDEYQAVYDGDKFVREFAVIGTHYHWSDDLLIYLEGRFDNSDFSGSLESVMKASDHDGVGIGIRYFL